LLQRLDAKLGKPHPYRPDVRALADREVQAADRQKIRRRSEREIDVQCALDQWQRGAVQRPVPFPVSDEFEPHRGSRSRACDDCPARPPVALAVDDIRELRTHARFVGLELARQTPPVGSLLEVCLLVTGHVEAPPAHVRCARKRLHDCGVGSRNPHRPV
jgi:hypothetical protein